MYTPFDWQESIGNRAEYADERLRQASPVIGVSLDAGVLLFTCCREATKLFDIYDRLAMGAIGQQSDIEAVRVTAVEFASREGYQRSESDVTAQRVVATVSAPIKTSFGSLSYAPFVLRALFAEVGSEPDKDAYYLLDYTGDYRLERDRVLLTGLEEPSTEIADSLKAVGRSLKPEKAIPALHEIWKNHAAEHADDPSVFDGLTWEALLIERKTDREDRFKKFTQP